ncbi:E3 ubiquitin-protein ligase DTX4-like [Spea bombifrons]|uniref:E3 ubiquitin-protein ligase DTX4-like n=1 Tax=Spea bombifrons TaxID=233779 RepID=UPI00234B2779|nr:E3 ubiquitin-protein ligase DTX4-like [Spea bombifrons]
MLDQGTVLVWEWQDEDHLWKPYSPQVAHYIEQVLQETPRANSVSLGEADANLTPYILDLISMNQFRLDTGTLYPVRRVKFPLFSAPGQGITWEFEENPGQWVPFETRLSVLIQGVLEKQQPGVRLGEPCSGTNICFQTMTKMEFPSQKRTRVRARGHYPYPSASKNPVPADLQSGLPLQQNYVIKSKIEPFHLKAEVIGNSPESLNFNNIGVDSNTKVVNYNFGTIHSKIGLSNSNHGSVIYKHGPDSSNNILVNSSAGLMNSNSGFTYCKTQEISNNGLDGYSPVVRNSKEGLQNTGCAHANPRLMKSESRPTKCSSHWDELVRIDSGPSNPWDELVNSLSTPSNPWDELVRCDSRPGDSRTGLERSNSRYADSRLSLNRSNSRPAKPGFIDYYSRSADSRPINLHSGMTYCKPTASSRNLSRSVSVRTSRSPPPCTCPQCVLVQTVKSSSWPGMQPGKRPEGGQQERRCKTGNLRIPLVPLSNIQGSGKIPPALAGISGLLISAVGLPICLSVPQTPILCPPPFKKREIRPVPGIMGSSRKISNKKGKKPEEIVKQFLLQVKIPPLEDCAVCLRPLSEREVGKLYRCSHTNHVRCLASLYKDGTLRCPACRTLYGIKLGSQPPGKMSFHLIPHSLPGHADCQTIRITFHITPGIQGHGQPNPGMKFSAPDFPLCCYLPNTEKGREVLRLLIEAWDHRLLFPLQTSRAPGVPDRVSTSRIPLKTEFGSNLTGKGYPDPQYLDSVLRQLRDWGMTGQ